jgi:hypothetical protein
MSRSCDTVPATVRGAPVAWRRWPLPDASSRPALVVSKGDATGPRSGAGLFFVHPGDQPGDRARGDAARPASAHPSLRAGALQAAS